MIPRRTGPDPLRYVPYHLIGDEPNVIVDGSATHGTVLTLSHWPGVPVPPGYEFDLSVQMALAYLGDWSSHYPAQVVSNNHFDQDGLTSVFALTDPEGANERAEFLAAVGQAGDFATGTSRDAARVSMAIAAFADRERTPLASPADDYETWCATLYDELLGRLPELCDHPDRYRHLWADEDATLEASLAAIDSASVVIEQIPDLDLAVVRVGPEAPQTGGHRFASQWSPGLHPIAVNNATPMLALLTLGENSYEFTYRYESWVQYRSTRPRARVDLGPLADLLTSEESARGRWVGESPGGLTPRLYLTGDEGSSLPPDHIRRRVVDHLRTAPPAWDPYQS